jgi:hypothetical protein
LTLKTTTRSKGNSFSRVKTARKGPRQGVKITGSINDRHGRHTFFVAGILCSVICR